MTTINLPPRTPSSFALGTDGSGDDFVVTDFDLRRHAVITGADDDTRSRIIKTLVAGLLDSGWDGVVVDTSSAPSSGGLRQFCAAQAAMRDVALQLLVISDDRASTPTSSSAPALDATRGGLTYIGLDTSSHPALSSMVSTVVVTGLSAYASDRVTGRVPVQGRPRPRFLLIDDASAVDGTALMALLSRARSGGIALLLCARDPLALPTGVAPNTSVAIALAQNSTASAQASALLLGPGASGTAPSAQQVQQLEPDQAIVRLGASKWQVVRT